MAFKFSDLQKEIYKKNLKAIKGGAIAKAFGAIKKPKDFAPHFGSDSLDINIQNLKDKSFIYENALAELTSKVALYQNKYILYPFLFFYGFGNGLLYKVLLQNEHLKLIVIFEESAELLWLAFHLVDLSKELEAQRLLIVMDFDKDKTFFRALFKSNAIGNYAKTYFLEPHSLYYERFADKMIETNKAITHIILETRVEHGNAPLDALQGITQKVLNYPAQITAPNIAELLRKRACPGKTAVCVATGPSLSKQLPLLKELQDKVAIFCADSAYPILMQNDIVPDYVFMLERTDFTAEFFNHDFKGKDKNTLFLLCDVVHPLAFEYLEKYNRKYAIFWREGIGMSVSSYIIMSAGYLKYTQILLIGQDLAYGKDGASHAKNYQHSEFYESDGKFNYKRLEVEAYGGGGFVETHAIWLLFKTQIEGNITLFKKATVYNCTEGGARIKGTVEMPFSKACEKFLKNEQKKAFKPLEAPPKKKQVHNFLRMYARMKKWIIKTEDIAKEYADTFEAMKHTFDVAQGLNQPSFEANKPYFEECERLINEVKEGLEDDEKYQYVNEMLNPTLYQFEQNIADLYVYNPQNEAEKNQKMFAWIAKHIDWLGQLIISLEAQRNALASSLTPLQNAIKKAGKDIEAKMQMIDAKPREALMFL